MTLYPYPSEEELKTIREWPHSKPYADLMQYVKSLWKYSDCGYWREPAPGVYHIATAGWSGNEDLISAMQGNYVFWSCCWVESVRGGAYGFAFPKCEYIFAPQFHREREGE